MGRCAGQRRARRPGDCSSLVAEQQMHIQEAATKTGSSGPTAKTNTHVPIDPPFLLGLWFHVRFTEEHARLCLFSYVIFNLASVSKDVGMLGAHIPVLSDAL